MKISGFDHFVLTVASIDKTVAFYERVLGMQAETFGEGRMALKFADQRSTCMKPAGPFRPTQTIRLPDQVTFA